MDSQLANTGPAPAAPETEPQRRRRTFSIIPFGHSLPEAPDMTDGASLPVDAVRHYGFDVIEADEPIDFQLLRLAKVRDELIAAQERFEAAKKVVEYYSSQESNLVAFLLENRADYEALIEKEHKGKTKYTDHALKFAGRSDIVMRVGLRAQPAAVNVFDEELLISTVTHFIEAPGKLKDNAPTWLKWNPPIEGYWSVAKVELNKAVKTGDELPGVEVIQKPDALYFTDQSRKGK
jgi:hypothetical protein